MVRSERYVIIKFNGIPAAGSTHSKHNLTKQIFAINISLYFSKRSKPLDDDV